MVYLLLSILSSTGIFVTFKLIDRTQVITLHAIIINYLAAFALGFLWNLSSLSTSLQYGYDWLWAAAVIGVLFILMFFVIAKSTQKAGITVTTIASKMSVVFPILFSIILEPNDHLSPTKAFAFLLALLSVFLASWKKRDRQVPRDVLLLPLLLFVGMGIVDSLVKYAQFRYVHDELSSLFSSITFLISALTGLAIFVTRKHEKLRQLFVGKTLFYGTMLGIFNYGSIYFMIQALNNIHINPRMPDSSVIFGINNLGIVLLSVVLGIVAFREKISRLNIAGICLSVLTLVLLMQFS